MKSLKNIGLLFLVAITLFSCTPNEEELLSPANLQNVAPENGKSFSGNDTLHPVTFRWTPVVPKPQQSIEYRLKVWQLMQGQNGNQAMRDNQPKVTIEVINLTETNVSGIYTGPCKPPYMCDFIWTVEAISIQNGASTGEVIGTSNPTVFNF